MQETRIDDDEIYLRGDGVEYSISKDEIKELVDEMGKALAREEIEQQIIETFPEHLNEDRITVDISSSGTPLVLEVRNYG